MSKTLTSECGRKSFLSCLLFNKKMKDRNTSYLKQIVIMVLHSVNKVFHYCLYLLTFFGKIIVAGWCCMLILFSNQRWTIYNLFLFEAWESGGSNGSSVGECWLSAYLTLVLPLPKEKKIYKLFISCLFECLFMHCIFTDM